METPFAIRLSHAEYAAMLARVAPGADEGAGVAPEQIVEGVIDLAFHDDRGWTIVDYKSDVGSLGIEPERLARYRAQVGLYAEVLERLTGRAVRERVILFTADGRTVKW